MSNLQVLTIVCFSVFFAFRSARQSFFCLLSYSFFETVFMLVCRMEVREWVDHVIFYGIEFRSGVEWFLHGGYSFMQNYEGRYAVFVLNSYFCNCFDCSY